MSEKRNFAAIMFSDVEGFTSMMHADEQETIRLIEWHRLLMQVHISERGGMVHQYFGDGSLILFPDAVQAVRCALEIQQTLLQETSVPLRIGMHWGEILRKGEHVYGLGINLAARIQAKGEAGSVLLSNALYEEIRNCPDLQTIRMGSFGLKNFVEPVVIHALEMEPKRKFLEVVNFQQEWHSQITRSLETSGCAPPIYSNSPTSLA